MPDPSIVRKVQALLDKAASTTFAEEAEALLAKAQELMTRDAIDDAMLAAAGGATSDAVISEETVVDPPYAAAKASLLGNVMRANGCRLIIVGPGRGTQRGVIVGHRRDIERAETLYQALSLHAIREMSGTPVPCHEGARAFRHAFLLAFASRVGERLRRSVREAETQACSVEPGGSVAVVLSDRSTAVEDAVRARFPRLVRQRPSVSSSSGLASGRAAADRASLGTPIGGRSAITR